MMTIGTRMEHPIGHVLPGVWLRGELVRQPLRVMGPSTVEAWLETYMEIFGHVPSPDEMAGLERPGTRFYLVSTD